MKVTRREFIGGLAAAAVMANTGSGGQPPSKIDRFALVSRHNPVLRKFEPLSPLSVGNGEFAFTCDVTGLQTFPELYENAMPLCTMSQWGWHRFPLPDDLKGVELKLAEYDTYGRKVGYMTSKAGQERHFNWLRENPHRLHLGQIGFRLIKADGSEAKASEITNIVQTLNLWKGTIESKFSFDGRSVYVETAAHPSRDILAVSAYSELIQNGQLSIRLSLPYGSPSMKAADWTQPQKHESILTRFENRARIDRVLDDDRYSIDIELLDAKIAQQGKHEFILNSENSNQMVVAFAFSRRPAPDRIEGPKVFHLAQVQWPMIWNEGAAIELSGSRDPRARELERRVVLSQYLTTIQCSGRTPPQETGLTCNSWYGKFHLEMHWWHAAHFALWNRTLLLERSLNWYIDVLPSAKERARQQGYTGARWAKMTAPDGRDSPSPIGPLLIWQQPHPIFYAELIYLNEPTKYTLWKYRSIVEETATFMASYAHFDEKTDRYVLGPPVIPAQENHPARETWNPTFELEYWHYGLKTAQKWRERTGQKRESKWDEIIKKLSKLPAKDGVYLAHENAPQTFTERNKDHPSMLAALGVLSGEKADRETMRRTLKKVMKEWDWPETWGWDYPMTAMTAARVGEPSIAIDALLLDTPKNRYAVNGHNYQRPNLPLYLPGNGGLLYAVALMVNGWKGSSKRHAPGFPSDGTWTVRAEGFDANIFRNI